MRGEQTGDFVKMVKEGRYKAESESESSEAELCRFVKRINLAKITSRKRHTVMGLRFGPSESTKEPVTIIERFK